MDGDTDRNLLQKPNLNKIMISSTTKLKKE